MKKHKKWQQRGLILGIGFVVMVGITIVALWAWIKITVLQKCRLAQKKYEGDCVEALIQVVDHEDNGFTERNYAIWTLGRLRDQRAVEVIEKYYTGDIPDREPYDQTLSQYEMRKTLSKLLFK